MEVNLIYSKSDPRQCQVRDFVKSYVKDRGVLASITEKDEAVDRLTVVINGHRLVDNRRSKRDGQAFPGVEEIAQELERHAWGV